MPEFAVVVTMPDCPRCTACKLDLRGRGLAITEISHEDAMQRHDRDEYMAALADNNMAFPIVNISAHQSGGWSGWKN